MSSINSYSIKSQVLFWLFLCFYCLNSDLLVVSLLGLECYALVFQMHAVNLVLCKSRAQMRCLIQ